MKVNQLTPIPPYTPFLGTVSCEHTIISGLFLDLEWWGHNEKPSHLMTKLQLSAGKGRSPRVRGMGLVPWVCLKYQLSANEKLIYIYLPFVNDPF